jgi:hypothetical protein
MEQPQPTVWLSPAGAGWQHIDCTQCKRRDDGRDFYILASLLALGLNAPDFRCLILYRTKQKDDTNFTNYHEKISGNS